MEMQINLNSLLRWYLQQRRILPWREEPTPYRVWISEIMLQQTQVGTVLPYFEKFMKSFPTLKKLAMAPTSEVLAHWSGLGYYSRAERLHQTGKQIYFENQGQFPKTREAWEKMPGIGPYTAGAILSIAQGQYEAILDGNVERVLSRLFLLKNKSEGWKKSYELMEQARIKKINPSDLNQAWMELGALICKPQPRCDECPFRKTCQAHQQNCESAFPIKAKKTKILQVQEFHIVFIQTSSNPLESQIALWIPPFKKWRRSLLDLPSIDDFNQTVEPVSVFKQHQHKQSWMKRTLKQTYTVTHHRVTRTHYMVETDLALKRLLKKHCPLLQWKNVQEILQKQHPVGAPVLKLVKSLVL